MTRTISLITAAAGAALLLAAPAHADSWGADRAKPTGAESSIEARERSLSTGAALAAGSDFYADGFAAAIARAAGDTVPSPVRDDRFAIDRSQVPVPTTQATAGRDVDWSQVGIGLALGLLLALGLYLATRVMRIRPLAH